MERTRGSCIVIEKALRPFICHGFEELGRSTGQAYGLCPLCFDPKHFYVNVEDGQYACHKCDSKGNTITFLGELIRCRKAETSRSAYRALARDRGLNLDAVRRFGLALAADGETWLLPCRSPKGTVRDVRRFYGQKTRSTAGCASYLFGLYEAKQAIDAGKQVTVYLCEGEWDTIALTELWDMMGYSGGVAVAVPGAKVLKDDWLQYFAGQRVCICYDNDDDGQLGADRAARLLKPVAKRIERLCWPNDYPDGFDLRDYVGAVIRKSYDPKKAWRKLTSLFTEAQEVEQQQAESEDETLLILPPEERPSFDDLLTAMRQWISVDSEVEVALRVALATCLTAKLDGDPLWTFLVGPPGCGKTSILTCLWRSDRIVYRSRVTNAQLVSGFQGPGGSDPSLLARVHHKTLVFKDWTEQLDRPAYQRDETNATLRGAFDGHVYASFGNGVVRNYDNLRFNMLAGVTHKIYAYADASLGERQLRLAMRRITREEEEDRLTMAFDHLLDTSNALAEAQELVRRFLARDPSGTDFRENDRRRLIALAQFASLLRVQVERDERERQVVQYVPQAEYATRLVRQLRKLAIGLCMVDDRRRFGKTQYAVCRRVALDTCPPLALSIVVRLLQSPTTVDGLAAATRGLKQTIYRACADLEVAGIIERDAYEQSRGGRRPMRWQVTGHAQELACAARVTDLEDRIYGVVETRRSTDTT